MDHSLLDSWWTIVIILQTLAMPMQDYRFETYNLNSVTKGMVFWFTATIVVMIFLKKKSIFFVFIKIPGFLWGIECLHFKYIFHSFSSHLKLSKGKKQLCIFEFAISGSRSIQLFCFNKLLCDKVVGVKTLLFIIFNFFF